MNASSPTHLAQRCAEQMFAQDTCAQSMGMTIDRVDSGFAQVSMTIAPNMLNGHQTCHGGQLFSLADTAFAYACNSQGLAAVASGCSIDFIRPGFSGDRLTACAEVRHQGKKPAYTTLRSLTKMAKPSHGSAAVRIVLVIPF